MNKTNKPLSRAEISSKAGLQAAKNMTSKQRSERARKGGRALWVKINSSTKEQK